MSLYCSAKGMAAPSQSQPRVPVGQSAGLPRRASVCCLAALLFVGCSTEHTELEFAAKSDVTYGAAAAEQSILIRNGRSLVCVRDPVLTVTASR